MIQENINIRSSSLNDYSDCQRRAATKIIPKLVKEAGYTMNNIIHGAAALVGTSSHKVMEYCLSEKISNGSIGEWKKAKESALDTWVDESRKNSLLWDSGTPDFKSAEKQISSIGLVYFNEVAPTKKPKATEAYFEADTGNGFILTGHIDDLEENNSLDDFKTGKNDCNYMAQIGSYSLLSRSNGFDIKEAGIDWIPRPRAGQIPEYKHIKYNVSDCESIAKNTIDHIKNSISSFKKNGDKNAFMANPSSSLCSNKFCPAHGTSFCEYTK